jgi:hypothetical protein
MATIIKMEFFWPEKPEDKTPVRRTNGETRVEALKNYK